MLPTTFRVVAPPAHFQHAAMNPMITYIRSGAAVCRTPPCRTSVYELHRGLSGWGRHLTYGTACQGRVTSGTTSRRRSLSGPSEGNWQRHCSVDIADGDEFLGHGGRRLLVCRRVQRGLVRWAETRCDGYKSIEYLPPCTSGLSQRRPSRSLGDRHWAAGVIRDAARFLVHKDVG